MSPRSRSKGTYEGIRLFFALFPLLLFLAAVVPMLPPGLTPQPIGPYLNGIFPTSTPGLGAGSGNWTLVNAYPNLTFDDPLSLVQIPDQSGFYVCGKPGFIWKIDSDSTTSTKSLVLDISSVVHTDGDAGFINMILHPDFGDISSANRGFIYLIYRYHPLGDAIGNCDADAFTRLSQIYQARWSGKF